MYTLSNFWRSNLACSNCPYRLVGNNDSRHIFGRDSTQTLLQLHFAYGIHQTFLVLLKCLTNTKNNIHSVFDERPALTVDILIALSVNCTTLTVSCQCPVDTARFQHRSRNITSECSLHLGRNHLSSNRKLPFHGIRHTFNKRKRNKDRDISCRFGCDRGSDTGSQSNGLIFRGRIQLPVSSNEWFPREQFRRWTVALLYDGCKCRHRREEGDGESRELHGNG
mmetsp:Transcript_10935/g.16396  ORF Transcript_10935/g.16396 Transcript_10935/m.16396 type:complete len:223 (+) Transcript_10935:3011-3679(+)